MPQYLRFDATSPTGCLYANHMPGQLFNLRPLALHSATKHVVYGQLNELPQVGQFNSMVPYTVQTYKERRLACDSALGMIMIDNPAFSAGGRAAMNTAITNYTNQLPHPPPQRHPPFVRAVDALDRAADVFVPGRNGAPGRERNLTEQAGRHVGASAPKTNFGRLRSSPEYWDQPLLRGNPQGNLTRWLGILQGTDIPRIYSLYDVFFDIYCTIESRKAGSEVQNSPKEESRRLNWREEWYDNAARGRVNIQSPGPTFAPGVIPLHLAQTWLPVLERAGVANGGNGDYSILKMFRSRGIDMFAIDRTSLHGQYSTILTNYNLNFSASASGTTSTLLGSAQSFDNNIIANDELFKEYLMGCIAYLVGGGMHTSFEVFYTASKRQNMFYLPGSYDAFLPTAFRSDPLHDQWKAEFRDVLEQNVKRF